MFSIKCLVMNCSDWQVYKKGLFRSGHPISRLKLKLMSCSSISKEDVMFVGIQILMKQSLKSSILL